MTRGAELSDVSYVFCFYVSGHGWGHATRANQIISDILKRSSKHKVYVISNALSFIFQEVTKLGAIYRFADTIDAGVVQPLAYTVDRVQTTHNLKKFIEKRHGALFAEIEWLKQIRADCVICDAPFLPCAAAAGADVPAVIASNFTFDEVYLGLCEGDELDNEITTLVKQVIEDYRCADLLVRLPGAIRTPSFEESETLVPIIPALTLPDGRVQLPHISLSVVPSSKPTSFERCIVDVPLVVRKSRTSRDKILENLRIPPEVYKTHRILLLSFGGQTLRKAVNWDEHPLPPNWICILCGTPDDELPSRFYRAPRDAYIPDLTNAADVVLGKLGYGTCSECIAHDTPMIYVPRPQFIEEYGLLKMMQDHGSVLELKREDFEAGRWADTIEKAADMLGVCHVSHGGGQVIAEIIEQFVGEWKERNGYDLSAPPAQDRITQ